MADDRYTWLDEDTAERLLRGLPVDARETRTPDPDAQAPARRDIQDEAPGRNVPKGEGRRNGEGALNVPSHAWFQDADRYAADRLAAALGELAAAHSTPPPATRGATSVELPGEAAALDAFRQARVGVLRSGSVGMPLPGADSASDSASAATAATGAPGRRQWGRPRERAGRTGPGRRGPRSVLGGGPLRAGFAMALAGCALGGVAVAAGTGVLPTPFGGGAPTVTVSPVASPSADDETDGTGGTGGADNGHDTAGDKRDGKHGSKNPDDDQDGAEERDDEVAESGSPSERGQDDRHGKSGRHESDDDERHGSGHGDDKKAIAAALCRAYSDGRLNASDRKRLERAAGGRAVVQQFCARYGLPPASSGGASNGAGGSGGSGHSGGGSGGSSPGGGHGGPGGDDSGGSEEPDDPDEEDDSGGTTSGAPIVPGTSGTTTASGTSGRSDASGGTEGE